VSLIAAIVGLALLVLLHEAGHFFAARAVGMTPRKFYLGFGPALVKRKRGGVEYGIGSIPLGGYVKIPGMNRPSAGELRRLLSTADQERLRGPLARLDVALESDDEDGARAATEELRPELGESRAWQELEMALAPDAYWRQATWRRLVAIGAGPTINLVFAIVLFTALFLVSTIQPTRTVAGVVAGTPAAAAHVHAKDEIVSIAGRPVTPDNITDRIRATKGRPVTLVVLRNGHRVTIGPIRAKLDAGAYRIGIEIEERSGPGESPPRAIKDALSTTWDVTSGTVSGIGHLVRGRDTDQVSSTVGIVRVSQQAWRDGVREFLSVLGLISLALGLLNLLPLLPLDGGHIVMALIERLRGRTFRQGAYVRYSVVGLALLAVVMYIGLNNDLHGLGGG
jgi:regulator of sigma E protease